MMHSSLSCVFWISCSALKVFDYWLWYKMSDETVFDIDSQSKGYAWSWANGCVWRWVYCRDTAIMRLVLDAPTIVLDAPTIMRELSSRLLEDGILQIFSPPCHGDSTARKNLSAGKIERKVSKKNFKVKCRMFSAARAFALQYNILQMLHHSKGTTGHFERCRCNTNSNSFLNLTQE